MPHLNPLKAFLLPVIVCCFSCKQQALPEPKIKMAFRDAVMKKYLQWADSSAYYDTATMDFQMLRAYTLNDSVRLKELLKSFSFKKTDWEKMWDSSFNVKDFWSIKGEEAYCFIYTAAFCPYRTFTTVVKSKDSIAVNTQVWRYEFYPTIICSLVERNDILLDSAQWSDFKASMDAADFWGLKEDNGNHGVDGNFIDIYGYQRDYRERKSYVSRWLPGNQAIMGPFMLLLTYCKTKNGCLRPVIK